MTQELMTVDSDRDLSMRRSPDVVLAEAKEAAVALKQVLDAKPNKVIMNDEVYLEFEDWQTIGRFYGLTVKVVATRPVSFGEVMGFEAEAVVLHNASGQEVSRAESMCLNDEEKWSSRPKYEWLYVKKSGGHAAEVGKDDKIWVENPKKPGKKMPKRERMKTGDERVPLFQLRSMAQTRACAKAFRNVLAWVVVMAGYKPTPAEELLDAHHVPADDSQLTEEVAKENHAAAEAGTAEADRFINGGVPPAYFDHRQKIFDARTIEEAQGARKAAFQDARLTKIDHDILDKALGERTKFLKGQKA